MRNVTICKSIASQTINRTLRTLLSSYSKQIQILKASHESRHFGRIQQQPVYLRQLINQVLSQFIDISFGASINMKQRNRNLT